MKRLLFIVLLTLILPISNAASSTVYTNSKYGFSITVPAGVPVETDEPPAPDHGLGIKLGADREVWISAFYDATFRGSAVAALREALSFERWDPKTSSRRTRIAGLPAARAEIDIDNRHAVRLAAFRARGRRIPILYLLSLNTDAAHATEDGAAFRSIVHSFVVRDLPR